MDRLNKYNCTGCGACYNICSKGAITMQGDECGFYKPVIDKDKCVNCGLCEKICPLDNYKSNNLEQPKVFAFQNKDEETLYKCASGGAFALFAKHIIEQGGIVYGVIYDENIVACHSRTDNLTELEKMLSSKYVQSDTKDTFKQAKTDLENGKKVLFSGTPCQIAGLKSYLQKDYENLITVDLVCHGTPSPLIFEKYKKEISKKLKKDEKIININFRSKINGWNPYSICVSTNKKELYIPAKDSIFMKLFLSDLSINSSCSDCMYNKIPRIADITVGDFWGVNQYNQDLNNNKGLSIVLINSSKGFEFYNKVVESNISKEVPLDAVVKYNKNIVSSSSKNENRIKFFESIRKNKSLKFCVKKYVNIQPFYMKLYNYLPNFIKNIVKYIYKYLKG